MKPAEFENTRIVWHHKYLGKDTSDDREYYSKDRSDLTEIEHREVRYAGYIPEGEVIHSTILEGKNYQAIHSDEGKGYFGYGDGLPVIVVVSEKADV